MRRATLMGFASTCGAVALLAARMPERVHSLVLWMPVPFGLESREDTHGWTATDVDAFFGDLQHAVRRWGAGDSIRLLGTGMGHQPQPAPNGLAGTEFRDARGRSVRTWKRSWTRCPRYLPVGSGAHTRPLAGWVPVPGSVWTLCDRPDSRRVVPPAAGVTAWFVDRAEVRPGVEPTRGSSDGHPALCRCGSFPRHGGLHRRRGVHWSCSPHRRCAGTRTCGRRTSASCAWRSKLPAGSS